MGHQKQVEQSGNKNPKVGTKWESGNKVGQEEPQSGNKKWDPVGTMNPQSGTRMGTKWELAKVFPQEWEQSGNKKPQSGKNNGNWDKNPSGTSKVAKRFWEQSENKNHQKWDNKEPESGNKVGTFLRTKRPRTRCL